MLVITIVCNLGMSTSMLVDKMAAYAEGKGVEVDIDARAFQRIDDRIKRTDILLIGPQVRHLAKKFQAQYGSEVPVIEIINMSDYALLKVENIFDAAHAQYLDKTKK